MSRVLLSLSFASLILTHAGAEQISATDAKLHIGQDETVCGEVASLHFAAHSRGEPTFIDIDSAYPHQVFTILIWGEDRTKFGDIQARYSAAHLCVTGTISEYRGAAEMVIHEPSRIVLTK